MKSIYECSVCGVVFAASEQLCRPQLQSDSHDYCGTTRGRDQVCAATKGSIPLVCSSCGRSAKQAELECYPLLIDS